MMRMQLSTVGWKSCSVIMCLMRLKGRPYGFGEKNDRNAVKDKYLFYFICETSIKGYLQLVLQRLLLCLELEILPKSNMQQETTE